jgi:hypothetical protein
MLKALLDNRSTAKAGGVTDVLVAEELGITARRSLKAVV